MGALALIVVQFLVVRSNEAADQMSGPFIIYQFVPVIFFFADGGAVSQYCICCGRRISEPRYIRDHADLRYRYLPRSRADGAHFGPRFGSSLLQLVPISLPSSGTCQT